MFEIDEKTKSFTEDESLQIKLPASESAGYTQFDGIFENIFILRNYKVLEKRSLADVNEVTLSIKLEEKVHPTAGNQMILSNDGSVCAIGGGNDKSHFYLIDLESKEQHKVTSATAVHSHAPCFINGNTAFVAIGGWDSSVEIWDINTRKSIRTLDLTGGLCSASKHNLLAFGSNQGILRLWDVRNWEVVHSSTFDGLQAYSLHLTSDLKFLTIAGTTGGDKCIVLEIK